MRLRDEADRVTRYVGVLDAAREHAAVAQQELTRHLPDRMNRRVYVLSVVAAIFLPLRWLTGLLGINVGGIPLTDNLLGFGTIVALRVALTPAQVIVFRWRKWFEAGQCATRGPRGRQKHGAHCSKSMTRPLARVASIRGDRSPWPIRVTRRLRPQG